MKNTWFLIGFIILLLPGVAQAACRVAEGATFCQNGMTWKCERCSSQLCEIMTGKSCGKVVDPKAEAEFQRRERDNLVAALTEANWKIKGPDGASELLGVKPTTLISRMKKWGLERPESAGS